MSQFGPALEGFLTILLDRGFDEDVVRTAIAEHEDDLFMGWIGPAADQVEIWIDAYPLCTNCGAEITDPTNPGEDPKWIHLETLETDCHPDDLATKGMRPDEGYVACPVPPNEDDGSLRTGEQYLRERNR